MFIIIIINKLTFDWYLRVKHQLTQGFEYQVDQLHIVLTQHFALRHVQVNE